MPVWPNGLGQTLGDILVTGAGMHLSGGVVYAHYGTGNDANSGLYPEAPKKTFSAAVGAANGHDMVVLMDGHNETVASAVTAAQVGLVIVGGGQTNGLPTARLTYNSATNPLITSSGAGFQFRNILVSANSQANASPRVDLTAAGAIVSGCYFECGQYDVAAAVNFRSSASYGTVEDCTFVATGSSVATRPVVGLAAAATSDYLRLRNVAFDGGTYGFSSGGLVLAAAVTGFRAERVSLTRGADVALLTSTGHFQATSVTGGARVIWAV